MIDDDDVIYAIARYLRDDREEFMLLGIALFDNSVIPDKERVVIALESFFQYFFHREYEPDILEWAKKLASDFNLETSDFIS